MASPVTCPYHFSLRLFTEVRRSSHGPIYWTIIMKRCCHTEVQAADQTQSQSTDTWPTSPSTSPITSNVSRGSRQITRLWVTDTTRPGKERADPPVYRSGGGRLTTRPPGQLSVGCLTSQQHASVSQERICSNNFTCCHTEIKVADQTLHLTQSQYTDTSPSTDPISPGAWQGSPWSANF